MVALDTYNVLHCWCLLRFLLSIYFKDEPSTKEVIMANKVNKKTRKREKQLKKVKQLVQVSNVTRFLEQETMLCETAVSTNAFCNLSTLLWWSQHCYWSTTIKMCSHIPLALNHCLVGLHVVLRWRRPVCVSTSTFSNYF